MQLYDPTNYRGICQKIDRLCDTTDTSYPRLKKTAEVNDAYETIIGWIIGADGTWQYDDSNYTDLPIGTQTLITTQKTYTFNDKFLEIIQVEVKNSSGDWEILKPIDQKEFSDDLPLEEAFSEDGMPEYYDKVSEDTIKLYPAPKTGSCTLTSGLRITFKRTASLFTPASTTAADTTVPGFASPWHEILAYMAAIPYCMTYKKDRVALYEKKVEELKKGLIDHYSKREMDKRKKMTMAIINFR